MMTEYTLQTIKIEIPSFVKARDKKGNSYYNYEIIATCPAPFKRWKVERRYGQFFDLYAFFCGTRKIKDVFPRPSIMQISFGKSKLAKLRREHLEAFLIELLGCPDLTMKEMNQLYHFLNVDLVVEDGMERDSDFGDVRKELFPDPLLSDDMDDEGGSTGLPGGEVSGSDLDDDIVKLTTSFNSEFRPTEDLSTEHLSSSARILVSVASFQQGSDTKEWHYSVSADGMKEALRNNDKRAVSDLLKKSKALATKVDDAGNPMIYTAALYGAIDVGIALIKAGADPHSVNRQGISAMDVAFDPWREAIDKFIAKREEGRSKESCKYKTINTIARKNVTGSLGLNIAKTTDNMPVVLSIKCTECEERGQEPDIKPNDIITAVNGVSISDLGTAVNMIKAAANEVRLTLIRRVVVREEHDSHFCDA